MIEVPLPLLGVMSKNQGIRKEEKVLVEPHPRAPPVEVELEIRLRERIRKRIRKTIRKEIRMAGPQQQLGPYSRSACVQLGVAAWQGGGQYVIRKKIRIRKTIRKKIRMTR